MGAVEKLCSDADDDVVTAVRHAPRNGAHEVEVASVGELKIMQAEDGRVVIRRVDGPFLPYLGSASGRNDVTLLALDVSRRLIDAVRRAENAEQRAEATADEAHATFVAAANVIAERNAARRASVAWKRLASILRRDVNYLDRELDATEYRAREAAREAHIVGQALAIAAAKRDALEARVRDLDASVEAMAIDRQRLQAEIKRLSADNDGMREEATMLLARARSAERRCAQQDAELVCRLAGMASAQRDAEQAHGQVEASRIVSDAWIESLEQDRDRHAARAADAEAACRDATAALVQAEARIDELERALKRAEASELLYENTLEALVHLVDGDEPMAERVFSDAKQKASAVIAPCFAVGYFDVISGHIKRLAEGT